MGRFVYLFEFWPEQLHCVEAFAICGYAFPSFPPLHLCNSLKTNRESLLYIATAELSSVDTDSHFEMEQE